MTQTTADRIQPDIEARLADVEPDVEVIACQQAGAEKLRIVIDHPQGVDLGLCERVTGHLRDLLADHGLEVSSPGPRRPLTKPEHFRRFLGHRAKIRARVEDGGRRSFTGELVGATDHEVTVAAESGVVSIPHTDIERSNLEEG